VCACARVCARACECVRVCMCVCVSPAGGPSFHVPKKPTDFHETCYEYYAIEITLFCDFVYSVIITWRLPKPSNSTV